MQDKRTSKFADLIIDYAMKIRKGEKVVIEATTEAAPLIKAMYKKCLETGAYPSVNITLDGIEELGFKYGSDEFLKYISPMEYAAAKEINHRIRIFAPYNTRSLANAAEEKLSLKQKSNKVLREITQAREGNGDFKWCITAYWCNASALEAKMSLEEYEDFVVGALRLDKADPIEAWLDAKKKQQEIIEYLKDKREIKVKGKNADLKVKVGGRTWVNCCGGANMPDGEIFTAPIENSAEGWINYSYPGLLFGKEFCNIRFEYKEGRVVKASAEKGEELVQQLLNMDEGMRYIGEFAFGTNYGITKFINNGLFDEKRGGTMHIANGNTLEGTGGLNRAPMHWDNITEIDDAEVYADGELFYKNGKFLVGSLND
jgi:aminopeptidase